MKKRLSFGVFIFILCVASLFACKSETIVLHEDKLVESTGDTVAEPEQLPITKHIRDITDFSEFYKYVEFELPEDMRQAVVDYMYNQASVKWVCNESFGVKENWEHWGINLDFRKNAKYTGLPYASSQVNVALFERVLDNGKYTSESSSWEEVHGVQCVSSILNSLQQVMIVDGWSYSLNPGSEDFDGKILGNYKVDVRPVNSETHTSVVCENNGAEIMYESYALAQKGDVVMKSDNTVHSRMVVDVTVVRNSSGAIDPVKSQVTCIEQTNTFDRTRNDHVNTTWFVDHKYTFENLYKNGYLPLTFEAYETGISHIPYITLSDEITPSMLAKASLVGDVRSNYPLRYVVLEILDENGETVREYISRGGMKDYGVGLRKCMFPFFGDTLEKGEYIFVLTAGIAMGEYEFERLQFSVE